MIEKMKENKAIAIVIIGCIVSVIIAVYSGIEEVKEVIEVEAEVIVFDKEPIMEGVDTLVIDSLSVDSI